MKISFRQLIRVVTTFGVVCFVTALVGCAPTSQQLLNANYGPRPTPSDLANIESTLGENLKDPYSAHWSTSLPQRAWAEVLGAAWKKKKFNYGWAVDFDVNAKNSFGGYVGEQYYTTMLLQGDQIVDFIGNLHIINWKQLNNESSTSQK